MDKMEAMETNNGENNGKNSINVQPGNDLANIVKVYLFLRFEQIAIIFLLLCSYI